jgi:hypothetical protein
MMEVKALEVVSKSCPSHGRYEGWTAWRDINPLVQVVLGYTFHTESSLLHRASILNGEGCYNKEQGQYTPAYKKLVEALAIREKLLGPHPQGHSLIYILMPRRKLRHFVRYCFDIIRRCILPFEDLSESQRQGQIFAAACTISA